MKQTSLLMKTFLLLCALVVGSTCAWADTKTEGFETKATSTTYNSTVTIDASESDCGIAWSIYYGTVSTNDKISGNRSAQMRWYSSATSSYPYAKTTTAIEGLSNVSLKARTSNLDVKMDVCYSEDGENWTVGKTHTFSKIGTGESVSLDIPSGNKYVKFAVSSSSTAPSSGNYKLIVDDVVFTYSSSLETPTWSVDPASATVNIGENIDLQLTTNYDGTLNFTSNDTDVATVSYNASTKVITVTGVSAGSTTITATGTATSNYQAITKNITVLVNHPELPNNVIDVMGPLGYSYFGLTPSGSNTYVNLDDESIDKTDAYGVNITFTRNSSNNPVPTKLRFDANYMRFYTGNSLTITAPAGSYIRKIVFTEPSTEKSWAGSMTADTGDYSEALKTWYANSGNVTSVVLTNDATKRIGGIEVYLNVSPVPVSISAAGLATFASNYALDFTSVDGIEAYIAKENGTKIELTKVTKVPAGAGVLLRSVSGEAKAADVPVTAAAADDVTGNLFVRGEGVVVESGTGPYNYVLGKHEGKVGFYKAGGMVVATDKAYLQTTISASSIAFDFDGETTALTLVNSEKRTVNSDIYNLAGQRVANPTKGLYIVNGKKVIVK